MESAEVTTSDVVARSSPDAIDASMMPGMAAIDWEALKPPAANLSMPAAASWALIGKSAPILEAASRIWFSSSVVAPAFTPAAVMVWSKFMNVLTLAAPRAVMPAAAGSIASPKSLTFFPALEISRPIRWLALLVSSILFRILASPLVTLSWSLMITSIISAIR